MFLDLGYGVGDSFVIDSHTVDEGPVLNKAEETRLRIAFLGLWSEGAYLYEAETHVGKGVVVLAVLVHTSRKSHRVRELNPENLFFEKGRGPLVEKAQYC